MSPIKSMLLVLLLVVGASLSVKPVGPAKRPSAGKNTPAMHHGGKSSGMHASGDSESKVMSAQTGASLEGDYTSGLGSLSDYAQVAVKPSAGKNTPAMHHGGKSSGMHASGDSESKVMSAQTGASSEGDSSSGLGSLSDSAQKNEKLAESLGVPSWLKKLIKSMTYSRKDKHNFFRKIISKYSGKLAQTLKMTDWLRTMLKGAKAGDAAPKNAGTTPKKECVQDLVNKLAQSPEKLEIAERSLNWVDEILKFQEKMVEGPDDDYKNEMKGKTIDDFVNWLDTKHDEIEGSTIDDVLDRVFASKDDEKKGSTTDAVVKAVLAPKHDEKKGSTTDAVVKAVLAPKKDEKKGSTTDAVVKAVLAPKKDEKKGSTTDAVVKAVLAPKTAPNPSTGITNTPGTAATPPSGMTNTPGTAANTTAGTPAPTRTMASQKPTKNRAHERKENCKGRKKCAHKNGRKMRHNKGGKKGKGPKKGDRMMVSQKQTTKAAPKKAPAATNANPKMSKLAHLLSNLE